MSSKGNRPKRSTSAAESDSVVKRKASQELLKQVLPSQKLTAFKIPRKVSSKKRDSASEKDDEEDIPLAQIIPSTSSTLPLRNETLDESEAKNKGVCEKFQSAKHSSNPEQSVNSPPLSTSRDSQPGRTKQAVGDQQTKISKHRNKKSHDTTNTKDAKAQTENKAGKSSGDSSSKASRSKKREMSKGKTVSTAKSASVDDTEVLEGNKAGRRRRSRVATASARGEESPNLKDDRSRTPSPKRSSRPSRRKSSRKVVDEDQNTDSPDSDDDQISEQEEMKPVTKPRRGRRPKSAAGKQREPETPKTKGKRGRKPVVPDSTCDEDAEDAEEELKCYHCDFSSPTFGKMRFHYASVHTLLYSKDEPKGTDDTGSMKRVFKMLGGKQSCRHCQKVIKTPAYYKQHVAWCVSDKEKTAECKVCGKQLAAFWIHSHEIACIKKKTKEAEEETAKETELSAMKTLSANNTSGKRKAAKKALGMIKDISKEKEEIDWRTMYTIPHMTVPSEETVEEWTQCAARGEAIRCAHEGCDVHYDTIKEITEHYWTCVKNGLKTQTWNCRKCSKTFTSEESVLSHVQAAHQPKVKKRKHELDDAAYKSASNSEDDEDDDISSGMHSGDEEGNRLVSDNESDDDRVRLRDRDSKVVGSYTSYPIRCSFTCKDLCQSLHSGGNSMMSTVLPDSSRMSHRRGDQSTQTDFTSLKFCVDNHPDLHQLKIGRTISHTDGHITYMGKPISRLCWCPVDRGAVCETQGDQYLAIVLDRRVCLDTKAAYSTSGEVDIWSISNLTSTTEPVAVRHSISLTHDFGYVHQMRWCYEGGFIPSLGDAGSSRLGLLALATSDGCVHIASVPFLPPKEESDPISTYSVVDDLKLCVNGSTAQCLCVDWQRQKTKFISAGFSDGSVAIWYVADKTRSKVLQPIRVFRSHPSLVTAIIWCPSNADLFATFSHGWFVWDMKDLSSPYFTPKSSDWCMDLHSRAVWPRMHHAVITCTDPSFGSSSVTIASLGYDAVTANQRVPVRDMLYTSDVDVCNCRDILVVSDTSGKVGWHNKIVPKYYKGPERPFMNKTAIQTVKAVDECIQFKFLGQEKQKIQGVKGNFCDASTLLENDREHSINSVSMNPNAGAHGWLLCGGTHGLLHVLKLA